MHRSNGLGGSMKYINQLMEMERLVKMKTKCEKHYTSTGKIGKSF